MTEKSEKLYEAMTEISDELITEAEEYSFSQSEEKNRRKDANTKIQTRKNYLKWGITVAACLCLFGGGVLSGVLLSEGKEKNPAKETAENEERNSFQFLVQNMAMNFANDNSQNNVKDIFASNYLNVTTDSYREILDLYGLYGITSGEKIEKIACRRYQQTQTQPYEITDADVIEEFYALTSMLTRYDTEAFFEDVVDQMSAKEKAAFHAECRFLEITTKDGLVFSYSVYPESGWLYSGGTMSYYRLSDELTNWFEENMEKTPEEFSVLSDSINAWRDAETGWFSWDGSRMLFEYPLDQTADELLAMIKDGSLGENFVVMEDSDITYGEENWRMFFDRTREGLDAQIQMAHYYTLDPERVSGKLYEQEKNNYPKLFFGSLLFYENQYYYLVKAYNTNEIENGDYVECKYLMKYEGKPSSQSARFSTYEYYVLVNDNTLTWKEIEHGILSSQMGDYIPHRKVLKKYYYE